ncbi:WD40 repeat domain-containing protein [Streptomyces sp. NPDC007157]|uniref:WD40 repeat domain-containing protein n=1 Tax=Streptomyces sp. NPDC007157 TaxID=3154681 RepID=UPI0033F86FE0
MTVEQSLAIWTQLEPAADQPGRWENESPYLLEHAARYAAEAGRLTNLLADADFLTHADPASVSQEIYRSAEARSCLPGIVYRSSYDRHKDAPPRIRRHILAFDAARAGDEALLRGLEQHSPWRIRWATGGQLAPALSLSLTGHENDASAVDTCLLDGRPVAVTGSEDGTVRLWDLLSGTVVRVLRGHTGWIGTVVTTVLRGRPAAVTCGDDGTVRVWDLLDGTAVDVQDHGPAKVHRLALHGSLLATAHSDGTVRWRDLFQRGAGTVVAAHQGAVSGVAVVEIEGRAHVLSAGHDAAVRLWDPAGLRATRTMAGHTGIVTSVTASALDGVPCAITTSSDGTVRIWDLRRETGPSLLTEHDRPFMNGTTGRVNGSHCFLATAADSTVRVWDLGTLRPVRRLPGRTVSADVAVCELNGTSHAVTCSASTVQVWDLAIAGLEPPLGAGHSNQVSTLSAVDLQGSPCVVSSSWDGTARVWDLSSGLRGELTGHRGGLRTVSTAVIDGRPSAISCSDDGTARVWNLLDGSAPQVLQQGNTPVTCAASYQRPEGTFVVTGDTSGTCRVWDLRTGHMLRTLTCHRGTVSGLGVTRIGGTTCLVTCGWDRTIRTFDLTTGEALQVMAGHEDTVNSLVVCAVDGRPHCLTTSHDHTARLWDLAWGTQAGVFTGHTSTVSAVALRDGTVATTGWDRTLRLWSLSATEQLDMYTFTDIVDAVTFGDDGSLVVGVGWEVAVVEHRSLPRR